MYRIFRFIFLFLTPLFLFPEQYTFAQKNYKIIPLPFAIDGINEEFSGMAWHKERVYLLPQYGDNKETKLQGSFNIYSILADSVSRVIDGKDASLTTFKTTKVKNLNLLPDFVQQSYQGFEAITIINNQVFLSIETNDTNKYCFLLKGILNIEKNILTIDPKQVISLEKLPGIANAGFESLAWLPKEKKLMAMYEFNAMANGGIGYLIDTSFVKVPKKITIPFMPFRITEAVATNSDQLYAINFYWNGDYASYLKNKVTNQEVGKFAPDLKDIIRKEPDYLLKPTTFYARILVMKGYRSRKWKQVTAFDGVQCNWEGMVLFRKGALVITDANRNKKQVTRLSYLEF